MKASSCVQSGASVQARENGRPSISRHAPVFSSPTSPGQGPEKLVARSSGLSLPTTPSHGVRAVEPVDADADHRVVDRARASRSTRAASRGSPRRGRARGRASSARAPSAASPPRCSAARARWASPARRPARTARLVWSWAGRVHPETGTRTQTRTGRRRGRRRRGGRRRRRRRGRAYGSPFNFAGVATLAFDEARLRGEIPRSARDVLCIAPERSKSLRG